MSLNVPDVLARRREYSQTRLKRFVDALRETLDEEDEAFGFGDHACLYVTGSGGRDELHEHSDVDVFIAHEEIERPRSRATLIQAGVVRASRACKLPPPSRDGAFLEPHSADDLVQLLGSPADDAQNTLTARMLLLLESRPLMGEAVYQRIVATVLDRYWAMSERHEGRFLPFMLANDIIRYWRIVLLNHEDKLVQQEHKLLRVQGAERAEVQARLRRKRKFNSYKMRFARCATCFSALIHMLAHTRVSGNMSREDAVEMVGLTPTMRLARVVDACPDALGRAQRLLDLYAQFLERTAVGEDAFLEQLADDGFARDISDESTAFTSEMLDLMMEELRDDPNDALFRHIVI